MNAKRHSYGPVETRPLDHEKLSHRGSLWIRAVLMFGALFTGMVLAIGHGVFYWWLNGKRIDQTLSQTWVTNLGTAFAFAIKMFLVIAAGTAFTQQQWRIFRARTFYVEEVDMLTGILEDLIALIDVRLWPKAPTLTTIAIIVWLIPVAAIFPPGTLRVAFISSDRQDRQQVAQLALTNNTNFAVRSGSIATNTYQDAAPIVYTAALGAGTTGQVLNIPHSYVNMSYDMQFYGPAIQCLNTSNDLREVLESHLNVTGSGGGYFYVSFVGGDDHGLFNRSGLKCQTTGEYNNFTECYRDVPTALQTPSSFQSLDFDSTDVARLFVMMTSPSSYNLFECHLHNASYDVSFVFQDSGQKTTIRELDILDQVAANSSAQSSCRSTDGFYGNGCLESSTVLTYQAIMQAFNSLYVGTLYGKYDLYTRYQTLIETLSIGLKMTDRENGVNITDYQRKMEKMFQNVTLSMLNFPALSANSSRAEVIPVTITSYPAIYDYAPLKLYLAYGLAIGCTLFCTVIGAYAMSVNGTSYTNKFSTFARATRQTQLYYMISQEDDASNPCPENIKKAQLTLAVGRDSELEPL